MKLDDALFTVLFSTILILLLIAAIIIVIIMTSRQRVKQQMGLATLRLNYEKELRLAECEMQENTMNNISRELHDNIGQLLTLMKIQIEQSKMEYAQAAQILAPVDDTLANVHQELRLLSRQLSSDMIHQDGLLQMIARDVAKLQLLPLFAITLQHDEKEPELSNDQRLMAYRIFQELLQNIIKHAQATTVSIRLQGSAGFLLQVSDNGKGFKYNSESLPGTGSGLKNILKRAAMVQFDCTIKSQEGSGSVVTISKPSIV